MMKPEMRSAPKQGVPVRAPAKQGPASVLKSKRAVKKPNAETFGGFLGAAP